MSEDPRPAVLAEKGILESDKINAQKESSNADNESLSEKSVKNSDGEVDKASKEPEIKAVSFTQLFRFATRTEIAMNTVGIFAAGISGAAQPLMSLIFGRLSQGFVSFLQALNDTTNPDPEVAQQAQENLPAFVAQFRKDSAFNASILVYMGLGMMLATYIYMTTWVYTGEVNAKRIRENYLKAILRQEIAFFDNVGAGEVATRIQTDTHLVQLGMSEKVALAFSYIASFFTGFILAYARCWRLALAMSSIIPCVLISGSVMNFFLAKYMQLSLTHMAESGSVAEEVISTIRTAKAFGSQSTLSAKYDSHITKAREVDLKKSIFLGGSLAVFFFIIYSSYGLAFSFGSRLINQGHADTSAVINVLFAILVGSFSLAGAAPEMQAIQQGCGAAAKLFHAIDRVPPIDSQDPSGEKPEKVEGRIVLEDVKFNYPSRPDVPVLKGISLAFEAGKTAALVGASGSGKSTIVQLIERFYDPLEGTVTLDGRALKDLNVKWLRSQVGLVSQEPVLFATTIKQNVAQGLIGTQYEHAPEDEKFALVREACVKSNADGFISKLPLGYDTMVGERGFLLSGGQKQRVAIARAIVSDPRILLLDEATSALDTQSEGIVQDALDKASAGRTTITIAHRLSTIKNADIIFVMGDGQLLEQGTHDELIAKGGSYAGLVQAQKLRESEESTEVAGGAVPQEKDMEQLAREEIPLGRKDTGHSVASEILEKRQAASKADAKTYGLRTIFIRLAKINSDLKLRYGLGVLFAILSGFTYPAYGVVFSLGIEGFSKEGSERQRAGDRNALWFFIIAIGSMLCIGGANYYFDSGAAVLTSRLRSMSFKAILRQDVAYFDEDSHSSGALTSNLSEKPQKVNGLFGITLEAIVQAISTYVAGVVLGLAFAWKPALVGLSCSPLLLGTGYAHLRVIVMKDEVSKKAHEESAQLACEAAGAIRTVAALTREQECCDIYSKSLEKPLESSTKAAIWSNAVYSFSQACIFFVIALVFWYGSRLVSSQEITIFEFFIALTGTTFGAQQAGGAFGFVPDISSARGAGSDLLRLFDSTPEIDSESEEGQRLKDKPTEGHIRFENVHFRYPTRPGVRVLRNLNLDIKPGTFVALVGASGCGKSTTIQLVERFYDPLAGNIYLDGVPISELHLREYREKIALVSQEPTLYAGTVRFNILLGAITAAEEVTQEELEQACRDANILDFIEGLPDGFDTQVGGKGSQLSGGQKQRIAIARALLRNPKILLLDEATSALDSNSEKVVQEALDKAAKGRTTIAIAHRLSTIQNADCIYFVKEGSISESGTHEELLSKRGDYYEYVQLQGLSRR